MSDMATTKELAQAIMALNRRMAVVEAAQAQTKLDMIGFTEAVADGLGHLRARIEGTADNGLVTAVLDEMERIQNEALEQRDRLDLIEQVLSDEVKTERIRSEGVFREFLSRHGAKI